MTRSMALVVGISLVSLATAQDEGRWKPPAPPEGWRSVASKDGRYYFAFPKDAGRSGTRDRSFSTRGLKISIQLNYCTLKDGTALEVRGSTLTGSELKGMTVGQVFDMLIEHEKEDGYKVMGPKEVTVGKIKAREYRLTKDKESRRLVMFSQKPRVFELEVASTDSAKLDTEVANTFVNSFVLIPAEVVQAAAKEKAQKRSEVDEANMAKYGAKWTANPKEMTPPDAPAIGVIRGREFKPDSVTLQPGGRLIFRQGAARRPDIEVELWLVGNEMIENKTFEVGRGIKSTVTPHIRLATTPEGAKVPKTEAFVANYSLKLTFGSKESDGSIQGAIYLCTPDAPRSFVAGKFTVKEK